MLTNEPQFKLPLKPAIPLSPTGSDAIHLPFWSGGNPATLQAAAATWRGLAADVKSLQQHAQRSVGQMSAGWSGTAANTFLSYWNSCSAQMSKAVSAWNEMAADLDKAATAISTAHHQYEVAVGTFAAFTVVSIALDLALDGATTELTVGEVDAGISEVTAILLELGRLLTTVAETLRVGVETVVDVVEFFANVTLNLAQQSTANALDGESWTKVNLQDAIVTGAVGFAAGRVTGAATVPSGTSFASQEFQKELANQLADANKSGATAIYKELKNEPHQ